MYFGSRLQSITVGKAQQQELVTLYPQMFNFLSLPLLQSRIPAWCYPLWVGPLSSVDAIKIHPTTTQACPEIRLLDDSTVCEVAN